MKGEFARNILFTGAGFTKNFGGLLAKEIWSKIFNNSCIQKHTRLKELFLNEYDYESIYNQIINGNYTNAEKDSINTSIFESYRILDEIVTQWTFTHTAPNPVNIYGVNNFIERFAGHGYEIGLLFIGSFYYQII